MLECTIFRCSGCELRFMKLWSAVWRNMRVSRPCSELFSYRRGQYPNGRIVAQRVCRLYQHINHFGGLTFATAGPRARLRAARWAGAICNVTTRLVSDFDKPPGLRTSYVCFHLQRSTITMAAIMPMTTFRVWARGCRRL